MNKSSKNSLAHTKWECKYHIVFVPKYRKQIIYRQIKADVGKKVRELCERNRNNRGRMLSGSYTYVGENTAKI